MPTGYTYPVQDGKITELRDFAMTCARAFGALITMREDPSDAPIPETFGANTKYHDDAITAAKAQRVEINMLSGAECDRRAAAHYANEMKRHNERLAEKALHRERYSAMASKVRAWQAPSEIAELKSFMLEQLSQSIDFDCSTDYIIEPKRMTGDEWKATMLASAEQNVAYHTKGRAEEIERTEGRNAWLRALRESLAGGMSDQAARYLNASTGDD